MVFVVAPRQRVGMTAKLNVGKLSLSLRCAVTGLRMLTVASSQGKGLCNARFCGSIERTSVMLPKVLSAERPWRVPYSLRETSTRATPGSRG